LFGFFGRRVLSRAVRKATRPGSKHPNRAGPPRPGGSGSAPDGRGSCCAGRRLCW
jgi:hypothetical protein